MLPPLIQRQQHKTRSRERGFTLALVAGAMVAMLGMAALSIDIGTLYQAKAEAQRAADAAALAAARVISVSGITSDPSSGGSDGSWGDICGGAGSPATLTATSVAQQNLIAGAAAATVNVTYGAGSAGGSNANCALLGNASTFGINPIVTVYVQRANLPIFFAKVFSLFPGVNYSGTGVSATATAEVFNPSNSGNGAAVPVPVQPRCVKPWIIPNTNSSGTNKLVAYPSGKIFNEGISELTGGVVGQQIVLNADCNAASPSTSCMSAAFPPPKNPPVWNATVTSGITTTLVYYVPALISGAPNAVPSCAAATNPFQEAIAGCDQNTVYTCGTAATIPTSTRADFTENPIYPSVLAGDTAAAAQCLINQANGQDSLTGWSLTTSPNFPFQIQAGAGNPLVTAGIVASNEIVTTSNSVVTLPIAEYYAAALNTAVTQPNVTIVGFAQVFITDVDGTGNVNGIVLNISGCGDSVPSTAVPVYGTSPVPIRLITPPS